VSYKEFRPPNIRWLGPCVKFNGHTAFFNTAALSELGVKPGQGLRLWVDREGARIGMAVDPASPYAMSPSKSCGALGQAFRHLRAEKGVYPLVRVDLCPVTHQVTVRRKDRP
jgi:hypothetical protein